MVFRHEIISMSEGERKASPGLPEGGRGNLETARALRASGGHREARGDRLSGVTDPNQKHRQLLRWPRNGSESVRNPDLVSPPTRAGKLQSDTGNPAR